MTPLFLAYGLGCMFALYAIASRGTANYDHTFHYDVLFTLLTIGSMHFIFTVVRDLYRWVLA